MCKSRKGTVRSSEAWKSQAMPGWWASLPGQHNIWRMRRCHQPLQTGFYESKRESVAPAKESSHRVVSRHKSQLFRRRTCASSEPATSQLVPRGSRSHGEGQRSCDLSCQHSVRWIFHVKVSTFQIDSVLRR